MGCPKACWRRWPERFSSMRPSERISLRPCARPAHDASEASPARQRVRRSVQRVLDSMIGAPAFVRNGRLDILAANQLGYALYSEMYFSPVRPANTARFVFLDPERATN